MAGSPTRSHSGRRHDQPVWQWLFRERIDPYHANERFKPRLKKLFPSLGLLTLTWWAGCRLGLARTELNDGRVFWNTGEHEDYYDPDFLIYNDIILEYPNGHVKIFGYPVTSFRPTGFHSATAVDDERSILIIGNVGYGMSDMECRIWNVGYGMSDMECRIWNVGYGMSDIQSNAMWGRLRFTDSISTRFRFNQSIQLAIDPGGSAITVQN